MNFTNILKIFRIKRRRLEEIQKILLYGSNVFSGLDSIGSAQKSVRKISSYQFTIYQVALTKFSSMISITMTFLLVQINFMNPV